MDKKIKQLIGTVYTTVASLQEAESLAKKVLEARLAVCINMIPGGTSMYIWENKIHTSAECYMLFKTKKNKTDDLEQFILKNHPYTLPVILKYDTEVSVSFFEYILVNAKN